MGNKPLDRHRVAHSYSSVNTFTSDIITPLGEESVRFEYAFDVPSEEPPSTWTFTATADDDESVSLDWTFDGFHGFFLDWAQLFVFADGPSGTTTTTLVSTPMCEFCPGEIDGPFSFSGSTSIDVQEGFAYGIIVKGANFDCCGALNGTIAIGVADDEDSDDEDSDDEDSDDEDSAEDARGGKAVDRL